MPKSHFLCLALCACTVTDPSGFLLGAPVAVTSGVEPSIRVKLPGFDSGSPSSSALDPFDKLRGHMLAWSVPPLADSTPPIIQAMSLGLEILNIGPKDLAGATLEGPQPLPGTQYALLALGTHGWTAFGFTVNPTSLVTGDLAPDIQEAVDNRTERRTVFNYFLPGSHIEGLEVESQSTRAMDPDALGLTSPDDAIHALDMHMALYHSDLGDYAALFTQRSLPPVSSGSLSVYFTLRQDFVTSLGNLRLDGQWGVPVGVGHIYVTTWTGTQWNKPKVYRSWQDLRFNGSPPPVVIDGLAVDAITPGTVHPSDRILFSLEGTPSYAPGAEDQVLFTSPGTTDAPRRVIVSKGPALFGSLGSQLGAGAAIGDLCEGDPWNSTNLPSMGPPVLDDFFFARRLPPANPWLDPTGTLSALGYEPDLALAASGYRIVKDEGGVKQPLLRTCMSWPRHCCGKSGTATVYWGTMQDFEWTPGFPGNIQWNGWNSMDYRGEPLTAERAVPGGGLLRPNPTGAKTRAFLAMWLLTVDGTTYRSPVVALRH